MVNKNIKRRIIEIAYKNKLSHLGSYLSCIDIIATIYNDYMQNDDIFILSNGHAALAQYVIIENKYGINAEMLFSKHGGHPHLDESNFIYCSTGSLGMGLSVAVGRALANPKRTVHVTVSDGECAEGVVWESLRFIQEKNISNIKVYIIHNGYGAYDPIDGKLLSKRIDGFNNGNLFMINVTSEEFPFLKGLNAHYHIMNEHDYQLALEMTK